jgi:hypothetical protein
LKGNLLYIFNFDTDEAELRTFIKNNFVIGKTDTTKIQITKNNFTWIYAKWCNDVKPTINIQDWGLAKQKDIYDFDFYLADILSTENMTFKDKLKVVLRHKQYEVDAHIDNLGMYSSNLVSFSDGQLAHSLFWNKYQRPPREEYWDYIMNRRDLLVPQDIRERKGSFFTPQIWVELSQKYIAAVFGENWQDEYFVWDCAAGTGNLLAGLTNKYNIWASTLDNADVKVMHERIQSGANLLEKHVFQFDLLNDDFSKLPPELLKIIRNTPEKLIIYINPPYAEAATANRKGNKYGVSESMIKNLYKLKLGNAVNEIFTQFIIRIFLEIPGCKLCEFSTLKVFTAPNFSDFRDTFHATFKRGFIVPANTFDNVKGNFPIGFKIWDTTKGKHFENATFDVYDSSGIFTGGKTYYNGTMIKFINDWYRKFYDKSSDAIGVFNTRGNDFQNQNYIFISTINNFNHTNIITHKNILQTCIYFSVRKVIPATWLNDRDQFLYPNDGWKDDLEFQSDCLVYTLFHNSNNIQSKHGINHWIPFTETEVNAQTRFESHFMTDFIAGKIVVAISNRPNGVMDFEDQAFPPLQEGAGGVGISRCDKTGVENSNYPVRSASTPSTLKGNLLAESTSLDSAVARNCPTRGELLSDDSNYPVRSASTPSTLKGNLQPLQFSPHATAVFDAGRELWRYYHSPNTPSASVHPSTRGEYNVNASFYDIREHFQGRDASGRMKNSSDDERYNKLIAELRLSMRLLAKQIEPKIYKYGFLKE